MLTALHDQLADLNWDGNTQVQRRDLIGPTLTTEIVLDIETDLTISGGAANGVLVVEQPLTLVPRVRIFDGTRDIVSIEPRQLAQLTERWSAKALSGVALADGSAQTIALRAQLRLPFADPLTVNPIETALIPVVPSTFYLEVQWAGTTTAALKAALVSAANDRTFAFSNTRVRIAQLHDPYAYRRGVRPMFLPRIRTMEQPATQTTTELEFQFKVANRLRWLLLHAQDAGVTTEAIINRITLRDDAETYRRNIPARSWHEREQSLYGGTTDATGLGMAYFYDSFAQFGRLGQTYSPQQGANLRAVLDVTGGASRKIVAILGELEQVAGLTAAAAPAFN